MIPNDSVVHLTMMRGATELAVGSGVLYQRHSRFYIVTAWHNVTGRHSETLRPLSKQGGFPDRVRATVACRISDGGVGGSFRLPVEVRLEDSDRAAYFVHPQGFPRIDVVAIPLDVTQAYPLSFKAADGSIHTFDAALKSTDGSGIDYGLSSIQDFAIDRPEIGDAFEKYLSVSDDLFVLGYPQGIIDQNGQPLWKRATVATMPLLGWMQQKKFLVDCASRSGMSGAPVVTFSKDGSFQIGGMRYHGRGPATLLHGIYVGRLGQADQMDAQIGVVWRKEVVDEIIDAKNEAPHSASVEAPPQEVRQLIADRWPVESGYAEALVNKTRETGWFSYQLAKELNGRAAFSDIDELVREEVDRRASPS